MNDKRNNFWICVCISVLLVFVITLISPNENNDSKKQCIKTGCTNERVYGSSYCNTHKPSLDSAGRNSSSGSGNSSSSSSGKSGSSSSSGSSNHKHGSSSGNTTTYNTLNCDPADYDDPDDYAEDAWGDDFEDYDEAYDFWEDY